MPVAEEITFPFWQLFRPVLQHTTCPGHRAAAALSPAGPAGAKALEAPVTPVTTARLGCGHGVDRLVCDRLVGVLIIPFCILCRWQ